ncbi:hypothetical protein PAXINDRAFT_176761 [Paxillus involutus ATCC 200175]|uniref:Uncharacterized protein n=1 Tax=Paxillus involutus ATCC 200175 TaxID=664439 RepID=A0A0C9U4P4_PAXIN|nr:hypothetical protein PAXINDRAFT_176761 [Paxillus involutus ATCC 200175]
MSYPSLQNGHAPVSTIPNYGHFPAFSLTQPVSKVFPQPQKSPSTSGPSGSTSFKAPAHKHAHHLHSIPPREKSTRTLIIDHMLWVHGRTRSAQARAELGMTDLTGGPLSPNYCFRERPEQYEEEEEIGSDGESIETLKARGAAGPGHAHSEDEDARMQGQNLALARNLRLRAIALEKVVTSMLDQPPPIHPVLDDELHSPPTSPQRSEFHSTPKASHPHTLPNGVRLRLALGTLINDLFSRQAPTEPYRHHHHPPPIIVSTRNSDQGSSDPLSPGSPVLPTPSPHPSIGTSSHSSGGVTGTLPPSLFLLSSISGAVGPQPLSSNSMASRTPPVLNMSGQHNVQRRIPPVPTSRVRGLYMAGVDPLTANSPPALRCPRHLHTSCEICVEAKSPAKAPGGPPRGRGASASAWGGEATSRPPQIGSGKSMGGSGGGVTGWQDGSGIGSGLAQPGINGSVLRRKSKWLHQDMEDDPGHAGSGAGNIRLSELIPRFLRLSALVAMELGQELWDEEPERDFQGERSSVETPFLTPGSPESPFQTRKSQSEGEVAPLRPSREWYLLFAGLLTRAALEGYLTGGWRGPDAAACLLSVGLGISDDASTSDDEDNGDSMFEWFEPDDLPTLKEAALVMFPALRATAGGIPLRRENAEAEFEAEMTERLRRFYAIPSLTPDLSTHMEDLAWHYPAEPVERVAVRFCEAIAKWRGKPELEGHKKKVKEPATPGISSMTIESLVHSNPTSPSTGAFPVQSSPPKPKRPSIEHYFILPQPLTSRKRRRSVDDGDRFRKRVH